MAIYEYHVGPDMSHEQPMRMAVAHRFQNLPEPQRADTVEDAVRAQASAIIQ